MNNAYFKLAMTVGILIFAMLGAVQLVLTQPAPKQTPPEEISTTIRAIAVKQQSLQMEVRSQGTVLPHIQSELIPEVSGRVKWISPNLATGGFFHEPWTIPTTALKFNYPKPGLIDQTPNLSMPALNYSACKPWSGKN